jgi:hypothetical protein
MKGALISSGCDEWGRFFGRIMRRKVRVLELISSQQPTILLSKMANRKGFICFAGKRTLAFTGPSASIHDPNLNLAIPYFDTLTGCSSTLISIPSRISLSFMAWNRFRGWPAVIFPHFQRAMTIYFCSILALSWLCRPRLTPYKIRRLVVLPVSEP